MDTNEAGTITTTEAYLIGILERAIAGARQASGSVKTLNTLFPNERDHQAKLGVLGARKRCDEIVEMVETMSKSFNPPARAAVAAAIEKRFQKRAPQAVPAAA